MIGVCLACVCCSRKASMVTGNMDRIGRKTCIPSEGASGSAFAICAVANRDAIWFARAGRLELPAITFSQPCHSYFLMPCALKCGSGQHP